MSEPAEATGTTAGAARDAPGTAAGDAAGDAPGTATVTSSAAGSGDGVCEESAFVTPALRAELLASYPDVRADLIADDLICHLAAHEDGDHFAILYDHLSGPDAGALWTRWSDDVPRVILLRPDCPARSPEDHIPCGHFTTHPGPHTWQTPTRPHPLNRPQG